VRPMAPKPFYFFNCLLCSISKILLRLVACSKLWLQRLPGIDKFVPVGIIRMAFRPFGMIKNGIHLSCQPTIQVHRHTADFSRTEGGQSNGEGRKPVDFIVDEMKQSRGDLNERVGLIPPMLSPVDMLIH